MITVVIILLIRLILPLSIFRWPLFGALVMLAAEIQDVKLFETFGPGHIPDIYYHNLDKLLDTYYLFFEFLVTRRWVDSLARKTAQGLFVWRLIGVLVFEVTSFFGVPFRPALVLGPNIFEYFYLFWTALKKWFPQFLLTPRKLFIILLVLGLPKIFQEYIMHYYYRNQIWFLFWDYFDGWFKS